MSSPSEIGEGETLVIRSHGVPRVVTDEVERLKVDYIDATCPFVAKIHKIVADAGDNGRTVLIAGDPRAQGSGRHRRSLQGGKFCFR